MIGMSASLALVLPFTEISDLCAGPSIGAGFAVTITACAILAKRHRQRSWSLQLLIELVPRLSRSKDGVLGFLRGAGVGEGLLAVHRQRLAADRSTISKCKLVRTVLSQIQSKATSA
ncbi:hypothetical protein ACFXKR_02005 [Streptomyces violascens]|uniref:hypothetical protein n=1 Tax=Streptomyces violascens TaxID=67381 RepID=UPI0036C8FBFF